MGKGFRSSVEKQLSSVKALRKCTDLEKSVAMIAVIFNNHTGPDGKLSKAQAKDLLLAQFQSFIKGQELRPKYKEIISDLDEDKDRKIDFEDFMIMLTSLTIVSDRMHELRFSCMVFKKVNMGLDLVLSSQHLLVCPEVIQNLCGCMAVSWGGKLINVGDMGQMAGGGPDIGQPASTDGHEATGDAIPK
ncbi:sentan-like [Mustelus asterias]